MIYQIETTHWETITLILIIAGLAIQILGVLTRKLFILIFGITLTVIFSFLETDITLCVGDIILAIIGFFALKKDGNIKKRE